MAKKTVSKKKEGEAPIDCTNPPQSKIEVLQSEKQEWEIIVDLLMNTDSRALMRIARNMLYQLHRMQNPKIGDVMKEITNISENPEDHDWYGVNIPKPRKDMTAIRVLQSKVFEIARECMNPEEIACLLHKWIKEDKVRPLLTTIQKKEVSLVDITDALNSFWYLPDNEASISPADNMAIKTALIRRFLASRLQYIKVAKEYVELEDFVTLLGNVVGTAKGGGMLGGKAAGIFLARKIVEKAMEKDPDLADIKFPRSWHITSDVLTDIVFYNDLNEFIHVKYQDPEDIRNGYPLQEQLLKNAAYSAEVISGLKRILRDVEGKPIIVRSSSILEDSFGSSFSGKYKSLFLTNTGTEEERLEGLKDAISEVYASIFSPDAIEYRRERGLLDFREEMGILIQEVVGTNVGPYYIPAFAGVAFSNNEFQWSPRILREDGMIRMVAGLGTRAVDRIGDDYPVLISPNRPEIRVNTMVDEIVRYSQKKMDVINIEVDGMETVEVMGVLRRYWDQYPMIEQIVSVHKNGTLSIPTGILDDPETSDFATTFQGLFQKSKFLVQIKKVLALLKDAMGTPVDVEFAHDGKNLYILQCRPQSQAPESRAVAVPKKIPADRKIFSASKHVTTSYTPCIEYLVCVDPDGYASLETREDMFRVAAVIRELNSLLPKRKFVLIGPGRWGSRGDIKLGVPVVYGDISNTALLVEVAKERGGYMPDLSFGTHFFQDLVEADIHYLPLYLDQKGFFLNTEMIEKAPNKLGELLAKQKDMEKVVKLISIKDISGGGVATVVMDGDANRALAYISEPMK